ncbi:hypothetical protein HDR66_03435 [bacterium]|nr:hypothetical protein [bacterium]
MYEIRLNNANVNVSRAAQNQRVAQGDKLVGAACVARNKTLAGLALRLSTMIEQRDKEAANPNCNPARLARFDKSIANIQGTLARAQKVR